MLIGSRDGTSFNTAIIIKNWDSQNVARVKLNGKIIEEGSDFRQGLTYDTDGSLMKIIWLKLNSSTPAEIDIH